MNADRKRRLAFRLQLVTVQNPFEQWGLDVVGEINPNSSKIHKYIITATDYFSKFTEAIPLMVINDHGYNSCNGTSLPGLEFLIA